MHYKNIHTRQIINWEDMEFGTVEKSFCGICNKEEPGFFDKNQELVEDIICDICSKSWVFVDEEDESEDKNEKDDEKYENQKDEPSKNEEEHIKK
jgi:hypothetical protein